MICPNCIKRMKVFDSRVYNINVRTRCYVCFKCEHRYVSTETLDVVPLAKQGVPKSLIATGGSPKGG